VIALLDAWSRRMGQSFPGSYIVIGQGPQAYEYAE